MNLRKIAQDVREYAKHKGLDPETALTEGIKEKAAKFIASGGEIYQSVSDARNDQ